MSSGPVVVAVLEGERAIERWRELMGATDPAKARQGTIRKQFGQERREERGAWLGRDPIPPRTRSAFFFSELEIAR